MAQHPTLSEFIYWEQESLSAGYADIGHILFAISLASRALHQDFSHLGFCSGTQLSGESLEGTERRREADNYAVARFKDILEATGKVCALTTPDEKIIPLNSHHARKGGYLVTLDPIDGSRNLDVNIASGTIFSIYKRLSPVGSPVVTGDFLQPGRMQLASGYVIYGPATILLYSRGYGVNAFTLDSQANQFYLTQDNIRYPKDHTFYSINENAEQKLEPGLQQYINYCRESDPATGRPYKPRYTGSLVTDFHRNLMKGGIYMYPSYMDHPNGKLHLLFQCNPLAFLAEQAGGKASNGKTSILELQPLEVGQQAPLLIGSEGMVRKAEEFIAG
ncbi:hypothetical protein BTA51_03450 [Hahella sp. CCB-MM4]|uniref:class 1 fructose-bisphosphatase n=1 Tax=Hahella sp. (strain CCB-MM4) TaxID=1926491 RepID=UPI000B9A5A95|nr:class 1 fructose-bisphosphatase [Hahella sp. CCB-MM4]OZG75440.1 hypothetical protein BTA51_03450 [Hahella sp. CCB-MM4]